MENKLELKHLAPYLPYYLKYQMWFSDNDNGINLMTGQNISDLIAYPHQFKPILRPMQDLTKEIEKWPDGEFIVGGERIRYWEDLNLDSNYEKMTYLFKNHYDVFGLIKQGIAIDINTLK